MLKLLSQWLRALDALNTRDDAYKLSIAGGLTVRASVEHLGMALIVPF